VEAIERMRRRGLKIGSTTGYTRPMLEILLKKAGTQGYKPDCSLVPDDVGGGRPLPWMCYEIALRLKVFPLQSFVKVGDTVADTEEGLNAGMWTVGVVRTGNMVGLTEAQFGALSAAERQARLQTARELLLEAGTHYVIDSVSDFDPVFDEIDARLQRGERP
jgi:phosphonoacetaldehyde hydrolase